MVADEQPLTDLQWAAKVWDDPEVPKNTGVVRASVDELCGFAREQLTEAFARVLTEFSQRVTGEVEILEDVPFAVGNVVRLKSGGPAMTVTESQEDNWVICEWFNGVSHGPGLLTSWSTWREAFPKACIEKEASLYGNGRDANTEANEVE